MNITDKCELDPALIFFEILRDKISAGLIQPETYVHSSFDSAQDDPELVEWVVP